MNSRGCMVSDPIKLFERKLAKAGQIAANRAAEYLQIRCGGHLFFYA